MPDSSGLKLKVTEALAKDLGRGLARLDPADMARLGLEVGDIVELEGKQTTVGKAMPAYKEHREQARVQIDGVTRENAGAALDQLINVRKATVRPAERVVLTPLGFVPADRDLEYIGSLFDGLPVLAGDRVRATLFGNRSADFKVDSTTPAGPVVIKPRTVLEIARSQSGRSKAAATEAEGSATDLVRGHRRFEARTCTGFARSWNCRCAIRRSSNGWGLIHPRGYCFTDRPVAARP